MTFDWLSQALQNAQEFIEKFHSQLLNMNKTFLDRDNVLVKKMNYIFICFILGFFVYGQACVCE